MGILHSASGKYCLSPRKFHVGANYPGNLVRLLALLARAAVLCLQLGAVLLQRQLQPVGVRCQLWAIMKTAVLGCRL